jgi:hypothetical protein
VTLDPPLERLRRAAARRRLAIVAAAALPLAVATVILAARIAGMPAALALAVVVLAAVAAVAWRAWHGIDEVWLARRLDAIEPRLDDSSALLFGDTAAHSGLQRLQRERVLSRLAASTADPRPAWPRPTLLASAALAIVLLLAALAWRPQGAGSDAAQPEEGSRTGDSTALAQVRLDIEAPAYTGLAPHAETALDAKAPEGSRLRWSLRFDPQPQAATLAFHDGSRLALVRDGAGWRGERVLAASSLYRIELEGAPPPADDRLHRLDAIVDRAPDVRVIEPEKTLTLLEARQDAWNLVFEAEDDYGIGTAELQVTLAQGGGENVTFKEQTIALQGEAAEAGAGAARHRRFRHGLDLAALGIAQGDDVIVRLVVGDNRQPTPNTTRSASFILRWPAEVSSDSAGLEGIVQKTMPAYFRSQRQIIIDSQALLAERGKLDDDTFLSRSDAIGVDQKILRLRYGQFLGEESETHAQHAQAEEQAASSADEHEGSHDEHADGDGHAHGAADPHAPGAPQAPAKFGAEGDTLAEYGHVHDIAEAATLLDPETKGILKSALAEMWQAELHLRQGRPDEALPYEHRALEFIKQVQQSTRIYLARVGLELPPPDEARRLSGERKGVEDRVGSLAAATVDDAAIAALWRALSAGGEPDWDTAVAWLREREASLPDALGALAAIDRARRDPACVPCRASLRDVLWPLLPVPATAGAPRAAPDAAGRAYLDALRPEGGATR